MDDMDKHLNDVIDGLWQRIMMTLQGHDGEICAGYLRASWQKMLFAEGRLESLVQHVDTYKRKLDSRQILDSLSLAMDYDHLLVSLRSSLQNIAYLVAAILLSSEDTSPVALGDDIDLCSVIDALEQSNQSGRDASVDKLVHYLQIKLDEPWYKELFEPAIIISHDMSRDYPRVSLSSLNEQLLDFRFLLPDMVESEDSGESSIIAYCRSMIGRVEDLQTEVFTQLKRCL